MDSKRIIVLIPAHDEEYAIGAALRSLQNQSRRPDAVIVVCDNCTDDTAGVAAAYGATTFVTEGNSHKKAGALNQALGRVLTDLDDQDAVLVLDADCALDPEFVATAETYVRRGYGGVGGVFRGGAGGGFVGHLQRNEYARYARDVARLNGRCLVLTGTAAMFRAEVLRSVSAARLAGTLPAGDGHGGVYDTTVLTEDNELTFALMHLGHRVIAPAQCTLETEVMLTWTELWRQRLRWKRGAIENCLQYGLTKVTWRYWGRQVVTFTGTVVSALYIAMIVLAAVSGGIHVAPVWLALSAVFVVERVVTVSYRGWKQMALAATMYELILDYFLQVCHVVAYANTALRTAKRW